MEALASYFKHLDKKATRKYYPLVQDLLNILPPIMNRKDSDQLGKALIALADLTVYTAKMFKDHFNDIVTFCVSVIQEKGLEDPCRQNALELLSTFADVAPSMCRKNPNYAEQMITQCLSMMTDFDDDDENIATWLESEDVSTPPRRASPASPPANPTSSIKARATSTTWSANRPWIVLRSGWVAPSF